MGWQVRWKWGPSRRSSNRYNEIVDFRLDRDPSEVSGTHQSAPSLLFGSTNWVRGRSVEPGMSLRHQKVKFKAARQPVETRRGHNSRLLSGTAQIRRKWADSTPFLMVMSGESIPAYIAIPAQVHG